MKNEEHAEQSRFMCLLPVRQSCKRAVVPLHSLASLYTLSQEAWLNHL